MAIDDAALARVLLDSLVRGQRDALHARQNQDGVGNAGISDGAIVDEIEVVARVQDLRNHSRRRAARPSTG